MAKDYKPDAAMSQGLVAQGIQIKRKEPEKSIEPPVAVSEDEPSIEGQTVIEPIKPVERVKRKTLLKGDYESLFIVKNDLKERKTIYVAKELQEKLSDVVMSMKNRDVTIGIYVENIILHHFEMYKDEINSISETKFKKPL